MRTNLDDYTSEMDIANDEKQKEANTFDIFGGFRTSKHAGARRERATARIRKRKAKRKSK